MSRTKKTKYYVPETKKETKSNMCMDGVHKQMLEMTDADGAIHVQIERDAAIDNLAMHIYKDPTAGIREYINNEARPCREAIKLGHDASIYVTVKPTERTIIIEGRESMGMTMDVFTDVYTVLGRSGNLDGHESGQFGFGRASYMCLSDVMVLETYSRETGEKFGFVGKSGKVYNPIPKDFLTIKQYGTKVTFTVREKISMHSLVKYIKYISKFLAVPVFIDITDRVELHPDKIENSSNDYENGVTQIGPVDMRNYLLKEMNVKKLEFVEIETEDYHFVGAWCNSYSKRVHGGYLIGIPTDMSIEVSFGVVSTHFDGFLLNVKNERKYMPTSSRDSLTAKSNNMLHDILINDIMDYLSKIKVRTVDDYYKSAHPIAVSYIRRLNSSKKQFDPKTVEFSRLMYTRFKFATHAEESRPIYTTIESLREQLNDSTAVYYSRNADSRNICALKKLEPKGTVIILEGSKKQKDQTAEKLESFGIVSVKDYLKSKNVVTERVYNTNITVHYCGPKSYLISQHMNSLNGRCIRLPVHMHLSEWLPRMRSKLIVNVGFIKDRKLLEDTKSVLLEEFCRTCVETEYVTSEGVMTGNDIISKYDKSDSRIVFWDDRNSKLIPSLTLKKCRDILGVDLVVEYDPPKSPSISTSEMLVVTTMIRNVECDENTFVLKSASDAQISEYVTFEELGIRTTGIWNANPEQAILHMSKIKNIPVRKFYAMTYNSIFRVAGGWGSTNTAQSDELEREIMKLDDASHAMTLTEICQEVINATKNETRDRNHFREISLNILVTAACGWDEQKPYSVIRKSLVPRVFNTVLKKAFTGTIDVQIIKNYTFVIEMDQQPIILDDSCILSLIADKCSAHYGRSTIQFVELTGAGRLVIEI